MRVCVCHNFLLSFNKFQTLLMCTGWVPAIRSDACVLKVFSLCLNVPSFNWLKRGKLSIFECLDNSELFIENVCMYNVSFFFPLSMYFFWSCWGRLYGQHEPLLCHTFLFPERY